MDSQILQSSNVSFINHSPPTNLRQPIGLDPLHTHNKHQWSVQSQFMKADTKFVCFFTAKNPEILHTGISCVNGNLMDEMINSFEFC